MKVPEVLQRLNEARGLPPVSRDRNCLPVGAKDCLDRAALVNATSATVSHDVNELDHLMPTRVQAVNRGVLRLREICQIPPDLTQPVLVDLRRAK